MAGYPIPPWLRPPEDPASTFLQAAHAGAAIATERERLTLSEQVAAREALRDQQQMEIDKARNAAEMGLKKRELDQAEQQIKLQVQTAARRTQAQQKYQQCIAGGGDPAKCLLMVGPDLGINMTGAAQLFKATQPQPALPPPSVETFDGEKFLKVPSRTGARYQPFRSTAEGTLTKQEQARLSVLKSQRMELAKNPLLALPTDKIKNPAMKADIESTRKKIAAIDEELSRIAPPVTSSSTATKRFVFNQETGEIESAQSQSDEEE